MSEPKTKQIKIEQITEAASSQPTVPPDAAAVLGVMERRRSIRKFAKQEIEEWKLVSILEAARGVPTAGNLQAFKVVVCRGRKGLYMDEWVDDAGVVLIFCYNPEASGKKYGRRGRNIYAIQDATIACAH